MKTKSTRRPPAPILIRTIVLNGPRNIPDHMVDDICDVVNGIDLGGIIRAKLTEAGFKVKDMAITVSS